jgi:hypothetical protein
VYLSAAHVRTKVHVVIHLFPILPHRQDLRNVPKKIRGASPKQRIFHYHYHACQSVFRCGVKAICVRHRPYSANKMPPMGINSYSSHRTKRKLRRELHARRESERIHVQHGGVIWIQKLCHRAIPWHSSRYRETLCRLAALLVLMKRLLLIHPRLGVQKRFWIRAGPGFGWVLVIDHIGLRIVLLFCTHGINLGRT